MNVRNHQESVGRMPICNRTQHAEKRWYVMKVGCRKEFKVKEYIDAMLNADAHFSSYVSQVLVSTEEEKTVRNGKVTIKTRPLYSGYVFVEAELTEDIQQTLRSVPNVFGFLSDSRSNTTPMPLTPQEVIRLLGIDTGDKDAIISFKIGEIVIVVDGPFDGFSAIVEEVDSGRQKLKISVSIFGRRTPLELGFSQVKKL